jgi:malate/lactate dehydrogenase
VESILEVSLTESEKEALHTSAQSVRKNVELAIAQCRSAIASLG